MEGKDAKSASLSSFIMRDGMEVAYYSLPALEAAGFGRISRLPFSIRVVLESLIRNADGSEITEEDVRALANWDPKKPGTREIPFKVSRILMQDFTGVPAVVDLAAMRDYMLASGKDPGLVQPKIPVDLVIDHSVQVDVFNSPDALQRNQEIETERNKERYKLLKWARSAFKNFRVLPPSAGICHQINLEYLATCVSLQEDGEEMFAVPDTLVGTDSHTTMVDSLGVVGFGVGGIEAEAALLNQPVGLTTPGVLGVHITGRLNEGVTATDFALTLTKKFRERGVVNMFIEFFGDGLDSLSLPDRATLSNMCSEYGATIALFPVDNETLRYLEATGRPKDQVDLVRQYYTAQEMMDIDYSKVEYSDVMDVNLSEIVPCVSGPSQPKQELPLWEVKDNFTKIFVKPSDGAEAKLSNSDYTRWTGESMSAASSPRPAACPTGRLRKVHLKYDDGYETDLSDGDVVISSITSCTNTSNPSVMVGAGILAKKALELGLTIDTRKVKTSLGPGSRVVVKYLERAGLMEPLARLGYGLVGYGCITCIGNSGPLIDKQSDAINASNLAVAAVLSGNRNYEARIHRDVRANYLMSPPMLIAYAIAGTMLRDLTKEPLGRSKDGRDVYLKDIWPSKEEINLAISGSVSRALFEEEYGSSLSNVNPYWDALPSASGPRYAWEQESTYIRLPPFFGAGGAHALENMPSARVLALFGDSISTDHISPAGAIGKDSPAGRYLTEHGVAQKDFNSYGSRRGNHEVMMRGTFANNRIKNLLTNGKEGGLTIHYPDGKEMAIYDACMAYRSEGVPLVVIAGLEYGSGSSRDWAAKGPMLLGVRAVVAKSFERIHRSNLVGMGVMPLQFKAGEDAQSLKMDCSKPVGVSFPDGLSPHGSARLSFTDSSGHTAQASLEIRIDNPIELEYYRAGGILNYVAGKLA